MLLTSVTNMTHRYCGRYDPLLYQKDGLYNDTHLKYTLSITWYDINCNIVI